MNMGEYMGTQRRSPEFFYFITCAVHSLLSRASVQFQLLPGREHVLRRVSQLTPLMGEALSPAGLELSKLLRKQSRSASNVPN